MEIEYAGTSGKAAKAVSDSTLTIAPRERVSNGRKAWVTPYVPKRLTARCCSSTARSLKSSYRATPALLMRTSSDSTRSTAACDLRRVGHVQGQRRDPPIRVGQRLARTGIHPLRAPPQGFLDQRLTDTTIGPGHQNCTACDRHTTLLTEPRCRRAGRPRSHGSEPLVRMARLCVRKSWFASEVTPTSPLMFFARQAWGGD